MSKPRNIRDPKLKVQQAPAVGSSPAALMRRYSQGPQAGRIPEDPTATVKPRFVSLSADSYHEMMNQVADIKSKFAALTARDRSVFQNDPYQWLRFCENPANRRVCLDKGWQTLTDAEIEQMQQAKDDARLKGLLDAIKPVSSAVSDSESQPNRAPNGASGSPQNGGRGG